MTPIRWALAGGDIDVLRDLLFALLLVAAAWWGMYAWRGHARLHAYGERRARDRRRDLQHASRLSVVGELTTMIAREIDRPLGAILCNADAGATLLEHANGRDATAEEIQRILADIRRDALRASAVIRQVSTLAGPRELHLERLDANAIARRSVRQLAAEMQRRRMAVEVEPLSSPAALCGDRVYLELALVHLLRNAMDAMERVAASPGHVPPPIVLAVARAGQGAVEFSIVDTGHGIPEERLPHLFHSFYSSKSHGMGLGLPVARSIVEAHGGWIRAENNRGPGATVRVTFPPYEQDGTSLHGR